MDLKGQGLIINLPEGRAEWIDRTHEKRMDRLKSKTERCDESDEYNDQDSQAASTSITSNNDHTIMQYLPPQNESSSSENDEDATSGTSEADESEVSLSPPASRPLLIVQLERLCGYAPSNTEEAKDLQSRACEAIFGPNASCTPESVLHMSGIEGDICTSFINHTADLFDTGIAVHSDTGQLQGFQSNNADYVIFPYPEYISVIQKDSTWTLMSTSKIWKEIIRPHKIPVVDRLLNLLSRCSRDIVWKYEMSKEIRCLARREDRIRFKEKKMRELKLWRTELRPAHLEKLYQVRETFELRVKWARKNYEALVQKRELRENQELQRRREYLHGSGSLSSFWFDGEVVNYEHSNDNENERDDDFSEHENVFYVSADKTSLFRSSLSTSLNGNVAHTEESKSTSVHTTENKSKAQKMQKLSIQQLLGSADKEVEQVRRLCTTQEELASLAVLTNLEKRFRQVDELLEKLQEEEWNDEESLYDTYFYEDMNENQDTGNISFTLLDKILAMVLGSLIPQKGQSFKDHCHFLRKEHETVVALWRDYFGRLPVAPKVLTQHVSCEIEERLGRECQMDRQSELEAEFLTSKDVAISTGDIINDDQKDPCTSSKAIHTSNARAVYGIVDNISSNWDDVEDWSEFLIPEASHQLQDSYHAQEINIGINSSSARTSVKVGSLRPGGSLVLFQEKL